MTINYTLEGANKTILYRASAYSNNPDITLSDVYQRFETGQSLASISADMPEIPKNKLLFARAFFASMNPEAYASSTVTPMRVLVDENVDPHIVTDTAREVFGHATHVSFVGLAYKRDVDVYKHALKNRYDLIVSKDMALVKSRATWDLSRCAHEFYQWRLNSGCNTTGDYIARLPRILHVMGANLSGEDIANNLKRNHRHVAAIFDEAASPTIQLHRDEAKPGKHFLEFIEDGRFQKLKSMRDGIVTQIMDAFCMDEEGTPNKQVAAMIKRVVEHEMYSQSRQPFYQKLSDDLKRESVCRSIIETAHPQASEHELANQITDYRMRGVVSVFNPNANIEPQKRNKDPLMVPVASRLKKFKKTGQLMVGRMAPRPLALA